MKRIACCLLLGLACADAAAASARCHVIYGGEERDGFMKVETGSGTAWVKAILMRKE